MSKKSDREQEKQDAITHLRAILKPGQSIYTVLTHVSSSGMSRSIKPVIVDRDPKYPGDEITDLTYYASRALGYRCDDKRGGVKMGGCGMDMGFALVYALGSVIWPHGTPRAHGKRNGVPDKTGGYALKHRWL